MGRRRAQRQDPIGSRVVESSDTSVVEKVRYILNKLNEEDRHILLLRLGLIDGRPRSLYEIGDIYGYHDKGVQEREQEILTMIRLRYGWDPLNGSRVPRQLREEIVGPLVPAPPLSWCDRHGWQDPEGSTGTCGQCPCPLFPAERRGRPRRYCSEACRKAANRQHGRTGPQAEPLEHPPSQR